MRKIIFVVMVATILLTFALSVFVRYTAGEIPLSIFLDLLGWAVLISQALILWFVGRIARERGPSPVAQHIYVVPLVLIMGSIFLSMSHLRNIEYPFYIVSDALRLGALLWGARVLAMRQKLASPATAPVELPATAPAELIAGVDEDDPLARFGDQSIHGNATRAVVFRAHRAEGIASFSLVMMVVIVLLGGGASIGLWFIDEVRLIHDLQQEKRNATNEVVHARDLARRLNRAARDIAIQNLGSRPNSQSVRVPQLQKIAEDLDSLAVTTHSLEQSQNYESVINTLETKSTNWPEIASRATIAILTFFLVQVFFTVHKYSRQLGSSLSTRAVALELIREDADQRQELRDKMIDIAVEPLPTFGPLPKTPVQDAINVAGKVISASRKTG